MAQPLIRPRPARLRVSRLMRAAATPRPGESDQPHGLPDPQSRVLRFALLPQPRIQSGRKPAPLRQVQQPQRSRPQLHPGSDRQGRSGPAFRLCGGFETAEEQTSELQSPVHLVCRLLLEKKKKIMLISLLSVLNIVLYYLFAFYFDSARV